MAIVIPGAADLLNGLINGRRGGAQMTQQPRQAMVFTSRLRQIVQLASEGDSTSRLIGEARLPSPEEVRAIVRALGYNKRGLMTNIVMAINPKSVKFAQPKRIKRTDTRNGSVFWHFTNSKGQNLDILTIDFAGNTGNLDLRGSLGPLKPQKAGEQLDRDANVAAGRRDTTNLDKGTDTGALNKLLVWQNLYLMTREPMLIGDTVPNTFTITYASSALPVVIEFDGFFDPVMEWEDSSDKPNSKDYSFKFVVTGTEPPLDDYLLSSIESLDEANLNEPAAGSGLSGGGVQGAGGTPVS